MKKPNSIKLFSDLNREKVVAISILVIGLFVVYSFSNINDSFSSLINAEEGEKKILIEQESPKTPEVSIQEDNMCYDCSGSVQGIFGTQRGNCAGIEVPVTDDNICTSSSVSFSDGINPEGKSIGDEVVIPKNCTLLVDEIEYPIYWNGHNKFVGGVTDKRVDWTTGEWNSAAMWESGGVNANTDDGEPTVVGNNYAKVYEPPGITLVGTEMGVERAGLEYKLDFQEKRSTSSGGDKNQTQIWYTDRLDENYPGHYLFERYGWPNPNFSLNAMQGAMVEANTPYPTTQGEIEKLLYEDERTGCNDYSHVEVVIGTSDNSCIKDMGFLGWLGHWEINIPITELCVKLGLCEGHDSSVVVLNMQEYSTTGRKITLDARAYPGEDNKNRYVATRAVFRKEGVGCDGTAFYGVAVWPDYLYANWKSSQLGSTVCDPEKNYATVISKNGPVTFNFCEYDGSYGYFSYVQYVTKRCNCVINEGCKPLNNDEYRSCKLMITGKG